MGIFDSIIKKKNEQRSAPVATEKKPEEPKAPARERKPLIDEGFLKIFSKQPMHEFSSCPEELISRMKLMQSPSEDIENMEKMESKARIFLKKFLGLELRIEPMADIVSEDAGISKWTATRLLKRMIGDARRDYEERAEGGCTDSYYRIGRMYRLGIGDDVSNDKAAEYFEIAAERDHAQAQLELANMMYTDPVLGVQTKRAGELYSKAAEHGIADAYVCLSGYYAMGLAGFPHSNQDCDRCWSIAAAKYEKGAFEGDAYSQYRYSRMFHRKVCLSKSDFKSESESARWCRMAAEQELADAQYELGEKYYFGKGVQKSSAKAIEWYTRAGRQGHVDAQRTLGLIYMEGLSVPVDFQKAVKWYKMAADQGDALSQCDLGDYYCRQGDQQNNYKTAVELYMRGAEKGYGASEYRMGQMYQYGKGVQKSIPEAIEWYRKALKNRIESAEDRLKELGAL